MNKKHISAEERTLLVVILLGASIVFAQAAWTEPTEAPPPVGQGVIPSTQGGTLHIGTAFEKKDYGTRTGWSAYDGGCPSAPGLYTNGHYGGVPTSRCLDADRMAGSLEVNDIYVRNAGGWASALYAAARSQVFKIKRVFMQTAISGTRAIATCPAPNTPSGIPPGGRTYNLVVGCSGAMYNFLGGTSVRRCSNYGDCGLIGADMVKRIGTTWVPTALDDAEGCMVKFDRDNNDSAIAVASCMEIEVRPP